MPCQLTGSLPPLLYYSLPPTQAMPLIDTMAAMLDMRRPDDLTRGPLRPDAVRRLAKALYNVRVSGAGRVEGREMHSDFKGEWVHAEWRTQVCEGEERASRSCPAAHKGESLSH